jgi:hypothetical protein
VIIKIKDFNAMSDKNDLIFQLKEENRILRGKLEEINKKITILVYDKNPTI